MADSSEAPNTLTRDEVIAELTGPGQSHELEPVLVGAATVRSFKNAPKSLRQLFADTRGDATFLVYENERWTFDEAWRDAARIATLLARDYGVVKGDRVAISMRNFPEWVLAFTAVTSLGAIAVAMNALWRPEELEYGLEDSGAKVLFADQERLERLADCSPDLKVQVIAVRPSGHDERELWGLLEGIGEVDMPAVDIQPDDPATIFYTSGSTGRPKGVVSSQRNIIAALFSWELDGLVAARMMGIEPVAPASQVATLLAVPLFHVTGSHAVYLSSYRAQRKMVCMYKWDPEAAAALIEEEKITSFVAPAAMTGDLVRIARQTERDLSTLMTVGGGGAPRAPEQVKQIEASFEKALPNTGWGMTETNAIGTGIGGLAYLERPASSGRSSIVLDLKVIDDKGQGLPAGERGELLVRGTSVFRGYWNRPEVNADVFIDGWFRTGDVAYLDDEGFLFIVDRIKDLIIRGGENIGCGQVEAALLRYPDVYEAAVYALPDERLGEEVATTLYANAAIDLDALRAFLNEHLARFEVPRYIRVSPDPLPRTASGKILKRELREEALAAMS